MKYHFERVSAGHGIWLACRNSSKLIFYFPCSRKVVNKIIFGVSLFPFISWFLVYTEICRPLNTLMFWGRIFEKVRNKPKCPKSAIPGVNMDPKWEYNFWRCVTTVVEALGGHFEDNQTEAFNSVFALPALQGKSSSIASQQDKKEWDCLLMPVFALCYLEHE